MARPSWLLPLALLVAAAAAAVTTLVELGEPDVTLLEGELGPVDLGEAAWGGKSSLAGLSSFLPTGFPAPSWHPVHGFPGDPGNPLRLKEGADSSASGSSYSSGGGGNYGPTGKLEGFSQDRCNFHGGGPNATKPAKTWPLKSMQWTRIGGTVDVNVFAWWNTEYSGLNIKVQSKSPILKDLFNFNFKEAETKGEKEKMKEEKEGKKPQFEKGEKKIIEKFAPIMSNCAKDHIIFEADSGCFEKCKFIMRKTVAILDKVYSGKNPKAYLDAEGMMADAHGCPKAAKATKPAANATATANQTATANKTAF